MSYSICIGPVLGNPETTMRLAFGRNVSATRVISFVQQNAQEKEKCGLITSREASEIIKETEEKLKSINLF
jgi:penicillin-binding protein-related factor A (putative recombinase)